MFPIDSRDVVTLLSSTAERYRRLVEDPSSVVGAKRTIAIDGKTLKGSRQPCLELTGLHTVGAFDTESDLTLAQLSGGYNTALLERILFQSTVLPV